MAAGKLLHLAVPQLPPLQNGNENSTYLEGCSEAQMTCRRGAHGGSSPGSPDPFKGFDTIFTEILRCDWPLRLRFSEHPVECSRDCMECDIATFKKMCKKGKPCLFSLNAQFGRHCSFSIARYVVGLLLLFLNE